MAKSKTDPQVTRDVTARGRAWKFHMCVLAVNLHGCVWSILSNFTMKQNGRHPLARPWIKTENFSKSNNSAVETHLMRTENFSKSNNSAVETHSDLAKKKKNKIKKINK